MYTYSYKIKFPDCDPAGVIYFAKIFDIAHQAYESFLSDAEELPDYFRSEEIALPIIKADAMFFKPLKLHEEINVVLFITSISKSSYTIKYEFVDENLITKAEATTIHVVIDKKVGTKASIPAELMTYLSCHHSEKD